MKKYFSIIKNTSLFDSIADDELEMLLNCLGATPVDIPKDGFALMAGDEPNYIGIVLSGRLQIIRDDVDGSRSVLASLEPGDFFAEALACAGIKHSPVSVAAVTASTVLRLGFRRILDTCPKSCAFHSKLIGNMVSVIAQKNIFLQGRMDILSKKSIREKLICYLSDEKKRHGDRFTVPFDRNGLAEFLATDRSALSRELSRLKDEEILDYYKNEFYVKW